VSQPPGFTRGPCVGGLSGRTLVFAGLDQDGRPVAMKTLDPRSLDQPIVQARFLCEQRLHARADGASHVVRLHQRQPDGWLITQWAHGGTLDEWMVSSARLRTPISPARVKGIVTALLRACQAIGARAVVHRDIKPSNVLLDGADIWLTDFGLAAAQDGDGTWRSLPVPWTECEIGTPGWVAPELEADPLLTLSANDVFSVGRVWHALAAACSTEPSSWIPLRQAMVQPNPHTRPSADAILFELANSP